jgi:hypothetical protein
VKKSVKNARFSVIFVQNHANFCPFSSCFGDCNRQVVFCVARRPERILRKKSRHSNASGAMRLSMFHVEHNKNSIGGAKSCIPTPFSLLPETPNSNSDSAETSLEDLSALLSPPMTAHPNGTRS